MYGRVDFDAYKNALKTCINQIPLVQGGLTRRPGTYFCDEVADTTASTRIVPFEFSTTQAYILEFGNFYIRFKRNNGPVLESAKTITGATQANPVVITSNAHGFSNGDMVDIGSVGGMTQLNNRRFVVANATANTFELSSVDGTAFSAYTSGGTASRVYTIASPYTTADLFQLRFTQSADTLYIVHPSYAPRSLGRTGHTSWTLTTLDLFDGPYLPTNSGTNTLGPSAVAGNIVITAAAVGGINGGAGFRASDVGRAVRIKHGTQWGQARITSIISTTQVNAEVRNGFGATTNSTEWRLGLYNDTDGWPAVATFFEDRLILGGSPSAPQRIDGSKTGEYTSSFVSFAPTVPEDGVVAASNAISATLNSNDVQVIRWMVDDEKGLLVGTTRAEWIVRAATTGEALSPTNISAKASTKYGSSNVAALRAGKAALYVQRAGRKVRELAYVYELDGFRSPDMTVLAEHVTKASTAATSGIKEMTFQQEPQSLVWAVRNDGTLLGFTYERDQKVLGWHRHQLGGYSDAGHTVAPLVESVAAIPSADGTRDELWMVVKRHINGSVKRYVEYMTKLWERGDSAADSVFGDCALSYSGSPVTTLSGLYHLAGETVSVLADGAAHVDVTVSSTGTITLTRAASTVHVGYTYNSDGQQLRPEAGAADGTAQGKTQRTHNLTFRLLDTGGLSVGPDFDSLDVVPFRKPSDATAAAVPLFSGDRTVSYEGDYTTENTPCWRFNGMLPGTVLAIMPQLHTQDR